MRLFISNSNTHQRLWWTLRTALFAVSFLFTLEMTTRIEQKLRYGAPILGKYTYDSVLYDIDEDGIHGKPHAMYEKWHLNAFGFRGPDFPIQKSVNTLRIACLGASETFGLFESPNHEWPRQLERILRQQDVNAEVMNTALAGMSLDRNAEYLQRHVLRFRPDIVIVMLEFTSYAGMSTEKMAAREKRLRALRAQRAQQTGFLDALTSPRLLTKFQDAVIPKLPMTLQKQFNTIKVQYKLGLRRRHLGEDFRSYRQLRSSEIEAFRRDLIRFRDMASQQGILVMFVTPAMWITEENLQTFYTSWPYIDGAWLQEALDVLPRLARQIAAQEKDVSFLDLTPIVSDRKPFLMKDLAHYSDAGAETVASAVADKVLHLLAGDTVWRMTFRSKRT